MPRRMPARLEQVATRLATLRDFADPAAHARSVVGAFLPDVLTLRPGQPARYQPGTGNGRALHDDAFGTALTVLHGSPLGITPSPHPIVPEFPHLLPANYDDLPSLADLFGLRPLAPARDAAPSTTAPLEVRGVHLVARSQSDERNGIRASCRSAPSVMRTCHSSVSPTTRSNRCSATTRAAPLRTRRVETERRSASFSPSTTPDRVVELKAVAVDESFHGRGVGTGMLSPSGEAALAVASGESSSAPAARGSASSRSTRRPASGWHGSSGTSSTRRAATPRISARTASRCATWSGWTSELDRAARMSLVADAELYVRGRRDPRRCRGRSTPARRPAAALVRAPGVAVAVFRSEPERSVYNNALLDRDLDARERADAIDAMEAAYAQAGITELRRLGPRERRRDAWRSRKRRGYTVTESTRAMGMTLDDIRLPPPEIDFAPAGLVGAPACPANFHRMSSCRRSLRLPHPGRLPRRRERRHRHGL